MIRIAQPLIGEEERAAVLAVLDSGRLAAGPVTRQLEEAFAAEVSGTREAVAVANGTAALHVALLAHGVGAGDEVITTPFTFQATSNMILAVGARPVFVDVAEDGNIDVSRVEAAITPRTRALLPVHLYGRLCDTAALADIAQRHGLALIEDAAQAHGASSGGRRAGSFGTGCFSFYATKNMTAGEGGMLTTDDAALAEHMRRLRSHGEEGRYRSVEVGYNYRMTDITSAIALAQLRRLPELTARRRANAAYLSARLRGVGLPPEPVEAESHVWHQYTLRVESGRDDLVAWLRARDIEAAVYYPETLPAQPLYRDLGYDAAAFPIAQRLAREVVSLPVHPALSESDLERVVEAVNAWATSTTPGKPANPTPLPPPPGNRAKSRRSTMSSREVAVGVVGLGFGAIHARVLSEMEGVRLAAVCDVDVSRLAAAGRGRTLRTYSSHETMLREEALDAVVVAVPTRLHEEVTLAAISAGKGVLVEKPLAPARVDGVRLAKAAAAAGVLLAAGHIERFNPAVQELRRRVQAGEAGRVLQAAARRVGPFAERIRDVGVIPDLAFHDVDVMRYVLGAEVESVYAETQTGVRTAFEDSVSGLLRFDGGALGVIEANWLTPRKVRELTVLGEQGLFVVDYLAQTLDFHQTEAGESAAARGQAWRTLANLRGSEAGPVVRIPVEAREPLEAELSAFVAAVRDGGAPPVSAKDALAALAVTDALGQSARTRLPVRLSREQGA